jgi:hypothetical protein
MSFGMVSNLIDGFFILSNFKLCLILYALLEISTNKTGELQIKYTYYKALKIMIYMEISYFL